MIDEFNALISNNTLELGSTIAAHNLVASGFFGQNTNLTGHWNVTKQDWSLPVIISK